MDVKIDCPCGTRFGFDVDPEEGHMPCAVACPGCGADGTAAADAFIRSRLNPPAAARPMRVSLSGHGSHPPSLTAATPSRSTAA